MQISKSRIRFSNLLLGSVSCLFFSAIFSPVVLAQDEALEPGTSQGTVVSGSLHHIENPALLSAIKSGKAGTVRLADKAGLLKFYEKNGKFEVGYIAQEVEQLYPHAVTVGADGYLSLSYSQVHTLKLAYLEDSIEEIKRKIAYLEQQLNNK